jgi:hypothetical protein
MTKEEFDELTDRTDGMTAPDQYFPKEPFPCPACGQLLAPSCRVCVACKHTIDPAELPRPRVVQIAPQPPQREPEPEPVRFSWRIFIFVLAAWVVSVTLVQRFMDPVKGEIVLIGVQILCSLWVLYDALEKKLPKPHRWGMGTLFLWLVVFPWYLARRQQPRRPCPFVEGQVSPAARAALVILMVVLFYLVFKQTPPH